MELLYCHTGNIAVRNGESLGRMRGSEVSARVCVALQCRMRCVLEIGGATIFADCGRLWPAWWAGSCLTPSPKRMQYFGLTGFVRNQFRAPGACKHGAAAARVALGPGGGIGEMTGLRARGRIMRAPRAGLAGGECPNAPASDNWPGGGLARRQAVARFKAFCGGARNLSGACRGSCARWRAWLAR